MRGNVACLMELMMVEKNNHVPLLKGWLSNLAIESGSVEWSKCSVLLEKTGQSL
jgi:hypothetical protein